jgi:uncharacterized protein (DUF1501 family)
MLPSFHTPPLSRRDWLKLSAVGALSLPVSGWLNVLAARAAEAQQTGAAKHKSCILLFMTGGPSHIDTFDPKPENKTSEFKPIATSVPGIQLCEHLPKVAQHMKDMVLLRGMSTTEGSHGRARYYMHTGYREGVGGVVHPSLGSLVSHFLGDKQASLPNFVSVGGRAYGPGYAGPFHAPVEVGDPARGVEFMKPNDSQQALDRRFDLLQELEKGFVDRLKAPVAEAHQATYQRASTLMHSKQGRAFDLADEPAAVRDAYGRGQFGNGCLLARRLVENGVPFVEVQMNGWDTHRDNGNRVKKLCNELDPAMASLLSDLKQRGMLDSTMVIWMGDFGRTPRTGKQGGRDHYPRAWTSVVAGGGLKGGQIVGHTDNEGGTVTERPISAVDFMATVCKGLGIDYTKDLYSREGRPMRVVAKGEKVISEVF